ncbi:MAG TPA: hypothetical protein VF260_00115 [Bacilli bacterium]
MNHSDYEDEWLEHDDFAPDSCAISFYPRFQFGRGPRKAFGNNYPPRNKWLRYGSVRERK